MTIIEFKNNSLKNIDSISITNSINNEALSLVAYYIYKRAINKNHRWDTKKITNLKKLSQYKDIVAISIIYPFPTNTSMFLNITKNLFLDAEQTINIVYWNKENIKTEVKYNFHLDYYLFMSIWNKFSTIT
jgi:hypothetical protein